MSVVVVGLSHRTVPLDLLERMTIDGTRLPKALGDLVGRQFLSEAVILSTCHRVEVYAVAERFHGAVQDIRNFLSELAFVAPEDFSDHLYAYYDEAAASHLFSVAAGLDSVVIGESQILGQVRDAWEQARAEGAAAGQLSALFRHSLEIGKRARSDTGIGRGITSLSQAAVAMARDRLGTLAGARVAVLGAGDMGEGMAAAWTTTAARGELAELAIVNRTWERAVELAERVGGKPVAFEDLRATVAGVDVLLTSTGAPSVVLEESDITGAIRDRADHPLLIVDLGMPRNVDPTVGEVPGVTLLDLADVRGFVEDRLKERRKEAVRVRAIVDEELARYVSSTVARQAAPTVTSLHQRAEEVRARELARFEARLAALEPKERQAVEALTRGIVAKLLHEPTVHLKDAAGSPQGERLSSALRELFDL
ncbi:MAG TPA: glutamyl-tRNA reductase [Acidimicrobiales bacterium]|nr:glutamyl-tRNA reductase [Acidimicrobiales bacterium]